MVGELNLLCQNHFVSNHAHMNLQEHQAEVDQHLYRTRTEMQGSLQPDGRSPKQASGLTSSSQLKTGLDNFQNSGTSLPSQVKGKKRERGDHCADPVKRERSSRADDGDSAKCKAESSVKPDIARIIQKGGLVDFEGVEKLVQLMQPDRVERKMDLISRSMLAGVVAATEKVECLQLFVQLKGLPVFDEWLQEIHRGKVGGGNNSRDGDKSVEEFLLVLLSALDKLPVNLPALQMCNIGRSVNNLRSHKNVEIQRKARSLVDIWKKRVQAEMTSIDADTGSAQGVSVWSSKSHHQEASHGGGRTLGGSDAALKSSMTQHSASKTTLLKSSHGESNTKSASSSPGPTKSVSPPSSSSPAVITSDVPLIRDDRSSSSNQSHSFNQSSLGKEEGRSSTLVSAAASKTSSSSPRYRKVSGFPGVIGGQKENSSGRSFSAHRSYTSDKLTQSCLTGEKDLEGPTIEASNHKLIVKIPNWVRSPAQGVGGASHNENSILSSLASPPVVSDQLDQLDNNSKEKSDAHQCNATSDIYVDSCQINDRKDISSGTGDGAGSHAVLSDEEKSMSTEDSSRSTEGPKKNQLKCVKLHETSFSPMNALIESCVKYSEAHSSLSPEDDVGMNLLASVATGEMSRSEFFSPTNSTERSTPAAEEVCVVGDEAKSKLSPGEFSNDAEGDAKKQVASNKPCDSAISDFSSEKSNKQTNTKEKMRDGETNKEIQDKKVPTSNSSLDNILNCSSDGTNASVAEEKSGCLSHSDKGKLVVEVASLNLSSNIECKSDVNEGLDKGTDSAHKFTAAVVKSELIEKANNEKLQKNAPWQRITSEGGDEVKFSEIDEMDTKIQVREVERDNSNSTVDKSTALVGHSIAGSCSKTDGLKSQNTDTEVEKKGSAEHISVSKRGFPVPVDHEGHRNDELRGLKPSEIKADEAKCDPLLRGLKPSSTVAEVFSSATALDPDTKVKFDLNEGFTIDDGKYGEPASLAASSSTSVQMTNSLQFSMNSIPTPLPASITVAAAAKGPFLPPEDLLRSKGELGWKGSAATSAFRPAEPRKVVEVSSPSTSLPYDASTSKNGRAILGIDLNIDLNFPDERVLEETASRDSTLSVGPTTDLVNNRAMLLNGSSGSMLDFDLNRVDESNENGQCSTSRNRNGDISMVRLKPLGCFPNTDVHRGFDLNDRPGVDDGSAEHLTISHQAKVGLPSQLPSVGPRQNIPALGSFSSWFSPGNTYSTVAIPSVIPDRADQHFPIIPPGAPQRTFGPAGITPFTPDVYRGSVLSSSPAVSFPSGPFQFSVYPFGPSYPLQSANFPIGATSCADSSSGARVFTPSVNSQLLGPVGAISSQFQRSYMVGLPDSSTNSGLENSRKWGRQGLDLNAGPGVIESEVKDGFFPLSSIQHSVGSSQVLAEEQARMYPASGNVLKRTEPEGGLDRDSFRYKQSS